MKLAGKIVVDATNPINPLLTRLAVGFNSSGAELLQSHARKAKFYKAFNSASVNVMAQPRLAEGKAVMFVAGPGGPDKETVLRIVADVGFEPVDAGELKAARLLEPLGMLWAQLALQETRATSPSLWRAAMPQTGIPSRALGWFTPILKKRSNYGYPC